MPDNDVEPKDLGSMETPPEEANPSTADTRMDIWRWPLAIVFLGLLALFAYIYTITRGEKAVEGISRDVSKVVESVVEAAGQFTKAEITHSFTSAIPTMQAGGTELTEPGAKAEILNFTPGTDLRDCAWSPDSKHIAFAAITIDILEGARPMFKAGN
mgnify:CR=1 FL=1